jgi:Tol biopolymer transport system component
MKTNRKYLILVLTIAGLVLSGRVVLSQQTAGELYEKALYLEEAKGELQGAIDLYNKIAENKSADQSFQAKALLHMGLCYEKMGMQEAVKSYQRLVNNFPAQKNEVAIARERLTKLMPVAEKVTNAPLIPKFTKIEIPTRPGNGVLSPDGKTLAYISDKALWIVPVHGKTNPNIAGEPVRLTESMDAWDMANMGTVWSSNSMWLAFYAAESAEDVIYIVSSNGGKPVKVSINPQRQGGYDYRMSLSPDGKMLAFVNRDDNKNSIIYTISTQGGTQNKLTGSGTREPAFSPDGKLVAYVKTKPTNDLGNEIWVIFSTGGDPVLVSDDADVVKSPVWSPDGSMIAFLARKYDKGWANNSNELWIAAVDSNGKPTGLITKTELSNSTTSMLAGWSPDNKIGIWLSKPEKNLLYTVPATGGQAMQITSKNSWMPAWSPDGKYLYFDGINTDNFAGVEFVPAIGGEVSRIPIKFRETIQPEMPIGGISVSPDGNKIVFETYYKNATSNQNKAEGFHHIVTVPVSGGSPVELTTNSLLDGYPVWSPDGKYVAFIRQEGKTSGGNIYTIAVEGVTLKKVTTLDDSVTFGRIDWSPDGKWIGFFSADNTIKMIPAEGGNSKVVIKDVEAHSHFGLSFSPGGNKIVYSNKEKLYVADLNTRKKEEVRTGIDAIPTMPVWSPDGSKIAFCAYDEGETDLWFMENFLPLIENKK